MHAASLIPYPLHIYSDAFQILHKFFSAVIMLLQCESAFSVSMKCCKDTLNSCFVPFIKDCRPLVLNATSSVMQCGLLFEPPYGLLLLDEFQLLQSENLEKMLGQVKCVSPTVCLILISHVY